MPLCLTQVMTIILMQNLGMSFCFPTCHYLTTKFVIHHHSDSTVPENSNLDDLTKLDATSEYYDGVTRKHPTRKSLGKASIASFLPKVKGSSIRSKSEKDNHLSAAFNMSFNKFEVTLKQLLNIQSKKVSFYINVFIFILLR